MTNGGFEQPGVTGSCCTTTRPDNLPGWTVKGGDVNAVTGSFNSGSGNRAYAGTQYLDLMGQINGGTTTLSQMLTTVANRFYNLTFAYSNNAFGGPISRTASFAAGA